MKKMVVQMPSDEETSKDKKDEEQICSLFGCEPNMKCRQIGKHCSPNNPENCIRVCDPTYGADESEKE